MQKNELLKKLSEGVVNVTFTKKDGTERAMACTRSTTLIPKSFHPKGETVEEQEIKDVIPVFDVEKQGWRSFNFTTLKV